MGRLLCVQSASILLGDSRLCAVLGHGHHGHVMAHLLRVLCFVKVIKDRFHGNRQCVEVQGTVVMCRKE